MTSEIDVTRTKELNEHLRSHAVSATVNMLVLCLNEQCMRH